MKETVIGKIIFSAKKSDKKLKRAIPYLSITNEQIVNILRSNKYLILETNNFWIVVHLGITGKLICTKSVPDKKHIHCILNFFDGTSLYYEDARRFGSLDLYSKKSEKYYLNISLFINLGGSSISDYVHTNDLKGEMQNFYFTYGRTSQECKKCSSKIERISQNGRGTFFCPTC